MEIRELLHVQFCSQRSRFRENPGPEMPHDMAFSMIVTDHRHAVEDMLSNEVCSFLPLWDDPHNKAKIAQPQRDPSSVDSDFAGGTLQTDIFSSYLKRGGRDFQADCVLRTLLPPPLPRALPTLIMVTFFGHSDN